MHPSRHLYRQSTRGKYDDDFTSYHAINVRLIFLVTLTGDESTDSVWQHLLDSIM